MPFSHLPPFLTSAFVALAHWLDNAHRDLDEAVFAAYDWKPGMSDDQIFEGLLSLNLAGQEQPSEQPAMKE